MTALRPIEPKSGALGPGTCAVARLMARTQFYHTSENRVVTATLKGRCSTVALSSFFFGLGGRCSLSMHLKITVA